MTTTISYLVLLLSVFVLTGIIYFALVKIKLI